MKTYNNVPAGKTCKNRAKFVTSSLLAFLCSFFLLTDINAQANYPVQSYTTLLPPYSTDVSALYAGVQEKMFVTIVNHDMAQPMLNVRLRMTIESNSFYLTNPPYVYTPVYQLLPGVSLRLSLNDLAVYFRQENIKLNGNPSEFLRTNRLPDGFYRFRFEVFDAATGQQLSNPHTGFAQAYIAAGDPPILNMPRKGEVVAESVIPTIFFQWTPRHFNSIAAAYNTEYEFTLVEIFDKNIAPEAVFNASRILLTETTRQSNFTYSSVYPPLIPGFRYAWRVRAVAREGIEEATVFKNNGYSEINYFDYTADCHAVSIFGAVCEDGQMKITWVNTEATEYQVEYKKKDADRWQTENAYGGIHLLSKLKGGDTYEFRVGCRCAMNDVYVYSRLQSFTVPDSKNTENNPKCGVMPESNLANKEPLQTLNVGDIVYAGDFPVKIALLTSASGGLFSGEGKITIPLLNKALVNVHFDRITINTDRRLLTGFFETKYDAKQNLITNLEEVIHGGSGVGDIRTGEEKAAYLLDFPITENTSVSIQRKSNAPIDDTIEGNTSDNKPVGGENARFVLTFTDESGNDHKVEVAQIPTTIEDSSGNTYEVAEGDNEGQGKITPISVKSTVALNPATQEKLRSEIAVIKFAAAQNTLYAFDAYQDVYKKNVDWFMDYKKTEEGFPADCKLIPVGKTDEIAAYVESNGKEFDYTKVHFVTTAGKEIQAVYQGDEATTSGGNHRWLLKLSASADNDGQEIYAVQAMSAKETATLGKLKVFSYAEKTVKVQLVPVNGFRLDNTESLKSDLHRIYQQVGINIEIAEAASFEYEPLENKPLQVTGSGLFSTLTDDMKALNNAYSRTSGYQSDVLYLFMLKEASDKDVKGDMPRGKQFGYLFFGSTDVGRTAAHELGHGIFKLQHTHESRFDKDTDLQDNLMSYGGGSQLAKRQWDMIHATGIVIGLFERDADGMFFGNDNKEVIRIINVLRQSKLSNKKALIGLRQTEVRRAGNVSINDSILSYIELQADKALKDSINVQSVTMGNKKETSMGTFWILKINNDISFYLKSERNRKVLYDYINGKNEDILLDNVQWYGQFNEIFKDPCGCWKTDDCNGKKITGNQCCNRAAKRIMTEAQATPDSRLIVSQTNRPCSNANGIIKYDDSGLTADVTEFNKAVQIIDISLKEHKLPVMVGVQHPYRIKDKWHYKCGSPSNNPRATNHFIVIVGKGYDNAKKMWFYYFYEVVANNVTDGTSKENKLWINTNQHLITGNVSLYKKENYYIVTDVRRNQGKIYNIK